MSQISTRIWLDEQVWNEARSRAVAEEITVRELIPRLVEQAMRAGTPAPGLLPAEGRQGTASLGPEAEGGLPTVGLSELYRCGVCGTEVKLGGLSNHMGKHLKERRALEEEGS